MKRSRIAVALTLAALAVGWELAGRLGASGALPPLSAVLKGAAAMLASGAALAAIAATLWKTALSLAIGCAAGVAAGLFIGAFRLVEAFCEPLVYLTYSLPRVALIPLFVLWLGLGDQSVVAAASVAVFYLVLINTVEGIKEVDPVLLSAARNLGASELQVIRAVLVPGAAGAILSAVRLAIGQALTSVVAGEIIIGNSGLGHAIWSARYRLDTVTVFASLIFLGLIGLGATELASGAGERAVRWRDRDLGAQGF